MIVLLLLLDFFHLSLVVCRAKQQVHTFYYLWYGNPEIDSAFKHWNHEILPHWEDRINQLYPTIGQRFQPPFDLHSSFYPSKGPYSSSDPNILKQHFKEIVNAGIDVIVASWWGQATNPASTDTQGVNTDQTIKKLLEIADQYNQEPEEPSQDGSIPIERRHPIKIAFHLEPYSGRTIHTVKNDIEYIVRRYGNYSSFYRDPERDNLPLYYIYDSYHIASYQWARLLTENGDLTIRKSIYDGIFIGLWLQPQHGKELKTGGFNGIYSYFATDGFSYGSTTQNWKSITSFCRKNHMICSLSVGPGYNDSLIRPWNDFNTRDRENGRYYEKMWKKAIEASPQYVSITTFNEWGEGTQIEPAKDYQTLTRSYLTYSLTKDGKKVDDNLYLQLTEKYSSHFKEDQIDPSDL